MTDQTISIRWHDTVPGDASNYGHDVHRLGILRDGEAYRTCTWHAAASALMEAGLTVHDAETIVRWCIEDDEAYDVCRGEVRNLTTGNTFRFPERVAS